MNKKEVLELLWFILDATPDNPNLLDELKETVRLMLVAMETNDESNT